MRLAPTLALVSTLSLAPVHAQTVPPPVNGSPVILDSNQGGTARALSLVDVRWGRLVDVYSSEPMARGGMGVPVEVLRYEDFVVGQGIESDGVDYRLERDPLNGQERVVILHPAGTTGFQSALANAEATLTVLPPVGLDPASLPPYPMVPRNAAAVLRFSDLLDATTVSAETVRVYVGDPPIGSFPARILPDSNHGALVAPNFDVATTRVIVDFSVDSAEALAAPTAIPVTVPGLPAGEPAGIRDATVQVPTVPDAGVGQFTVLRNLAGAVVTDALTLSNPTLDVVRAFRRGREGGLDPNNGFLQDADAPAIVARQPIANLTSRKPALGAPGDVIVSFAFVEAACEPAAAVGHLLEAGGEVGTVLGVGGAVPALGPDELYVRVRGGRPAARRFAAATSGLYAFEVDADDALTLPCYVQLLPPPNGPVGTGAAPETQVRLVLNEPVLPASVSTFDNVVLRDDAATDPLAERIVAEGALDADLREVSVLPVAPLDHAAGATESYTLDVASGSGALTDLAGNPLLVGALQTFTLDPNAPAADTGNLSLDFGEIDENGDGTPGDPAPEIRGQFSYDLANGTIHPRPVTRASQTVDRDKPLVSIMPTTSAPLIAPISPLGSRMMTVWRYADAGFQVLDESTTNIDVEGISWAPFGGSVSVDFFSEFEMRLGHSAFQPDEFPVPITVGGGGYAMFPSSGLQKAFAQNALEGATAVVHERQQGYLLSPLDAFVATSGTTMLPFPLNRGVAAEDFSYFTWRDTAVLDAGGANGFGADLRALELVGALPCTDSPFPTVYEPGSVRSAALPLLIEFRCFPDDGAIGLNGLDTSFALATERRPIFRVHSTGGFNKSGIAVTVDPDVSTSASGGFGPSGTKTVPDDNTFMIGQLDTVVRVSRVHSAWFRASASGVDFLAPLVDPAPANQPAGTQLLLAFRGATNVGGADVADARNYDLYGDPLVTRTITGPGCPGSGYAAQNDLVVEVADITVDFLASDETWKSSIDDVDGASWVQIRATFVSNATTGETPELDGLGLAFVE